MTEKIIVRMIADGSKLGRIQEESEKTSQFVKIIEQNRRNSVNGFVNLLTLEVNFLEQARFFKMVEA